MFKQYEENENLEQHAEALDELYEGYDFTDQPWGYSKDYLNYIRDSIHKPIAQHLQPGSILDAGGGYGFFRRYTNSQTHINLDLSKEIIKYDKGELKTLGPIEDIPFADSTFENVVCTGVLRHCYEPQKFLDEAKRVLKENGRLLISTVSDDWPSNFNHTPWVFFSLFAIFEERVKDLFTEDSVETGSIYDRRYSLEELSSLVNDKGFEIIKECPART